jgi:hypothetical protein
MISVAKALSGQDTMLLPPREAPYHLQGVYERVLDGCREEFILDLDGSYLEVRVDENTDTLHPQFHGTGFNSSSGYRKYEPGGYRSLRSVWPWEQWIGKECGWTWLGSGGKISNLDYRERQNRTNRECGLGARESGAAERERPAP